VQWKDAAIAINKIGISQGWLPADSEVVSFTGEQTGNVMSDIPSLIGKYLWGANTRAVSEKAKRLGWKPKGPSFWETLEQEVTITVSESKKN